PSPPALTVEPVEAPIVAPVENAIPLPVPPPSQGPCHTVVESSTMLRVISLEEEREIEDHIVGAWQCQGAIESNETSNPSCAVPIVALTPGQLQTQSLGARGYWMLSVMRVVMLMPNSTVSARLLSSDHVSGKLRLVSLLSQEEFDSLLSGELEAEVHPVTVQDVVWSGAEDDKLKYSDGWVTDRSVAGLE
ncbi:hypothetical protein BDM02DRAFT_3132580, partial [Thelephora ganbajun]